MVWWEINNPQQSRGERGGQHMPGTVGNGVWNDLGYSRAYCDGLCQWQGEFASLSYKGKPDQDCWQGFCKGGPASLRGNHSNCQVVMPTLSPKLPLVPGSQRCQLRSMRLVSVNWLLKSVPRGYRIAMRQHLPLMWNKKRSLQKEGQRMYKINPGGSGQEYVTVLGCRSASGTRLPPYT